jgi:GDPmannose 4,6-dehydratase
LKNPKTKIALVTGVTGQDGAYLSQLLLSKNYIVIGTYRRSSAPNFWRLNYLGLNTHNNFSLEELDITDFGACINLLNRIQPDEFYNLAAQSFVGSSFTHPHATTLITGNAVLNMLEAIRIVNKNIKFYQASTSEMFGLVQEVPQRESTQFYPRSPYGVSKLYAHWMTVNYRESYGLFASSGILFNHESPLRGLEFITRKITSAAAKIKLGLTDVLEVGNLDAQRDWGYAKDYVEGMWAMLQHSSPDTFVLSTGSTYTVREFIVMAFNYCKIDVVFQGRDSDEVGINCSTGKTIVKVNKEFYRPSEVELLIGDSTKAKDKLGWSHKTNLLELCKIMIDEDILRYKKDKNFPS